MAYITFNDGSAATLHASIPAPGDRLANWIPTNYRPVGGATHVTANERRHVFVVRRQYGAAFEVRPLYAGGQAPSDLDIAERIVAHLRDGGTCALYTEDADAAEYTNCALWPGSVPSIRQIDPRTLEYALSIHLINLAGAAMTMHHD